MDRLDLAQMGDAGRASSGSGASRAGSPRRLCATGSAVVVRRTAGRSSDGAGYSIRLIMSVISRGGCNTSHKRGCVATVGDGGGRAEEIMKKAIRLATFKWRQTERELIFAPCAGTFF